MWYANLDIYIALILIFEVQKRANFGKMLYRLTYSVLLVEVMMINKCATLQNSMSKDLYLRWYAHLNEEQCRG